MATKHKITIPNPCNENWDEMTPKDNGRFCLSCTKTVVDFTAMLPEEIQHYFISNQNKSVCGRFKKSQLDNIIIQIPNHVLHSQTHYHKMFLLALFISMGTTLFSCADKNGTKQKINKIEIVEDSSTTENIMVGDIKASENNPRYPPPPPPKVDQVKFVKPVSITTNKKIKLKKQSKISCEENSVTEDVYSGYTAIEVDPEYSGGIEKFYTFFKDNFRSPEEARAKYGEIELSFVISKDGSIEDIKPIKDMGFGNMDEAIRVLKSSKKWKPGEQNGKKTRIRYLLSIQKDTQNSSIENNISTITAISAVKG